jgi:hypothetical protein
LEVAEEQQHRNRGDQGDQVTHRGLGGRCAGGCHAARAASPAHG